jgi:PDZ domain/Aspartyl protease
VIQGGEAGMERQRWLAKAFQRIHGDVMLLKRTMLILAIFFLCQASEASSTDERIFISAQVNGQPIRLAFDTGASFTLLFSSSALRLGLKYTPHTTNTPLAAGQIQLGDTEEFTLGWGPTNIRTRFYVVDVPKYVHPDFDGFIGWNWAASNIIMIDAEGQKVAFPAELPKQVATWTKLPLRTNSSTLQFEVSEGDHTNEIVVVDTGDPGGVALRPNKWREWKSSHTEQPSTLNSTFMLASGISVTEEAWAKKLVVGPLVLTDVPVAEATPPQQETGIGTERFDCTLGFAALKRIDLIVDGAHGMAYLKPKTTRPPAYQHNRLGAVFVPANSQSDTLAAHIVAGSPAYEAGIRNGDELLRVDKRDISHWRIDPDIHPNLVFREKPAGTKIVLTLKRGGETIEATVILRDIVAPEAIKP